jgi:hypothetical protein
METLGFVSIRLIFLISQLIHIGGFERAHPSQDSRNNTKALRDITMKLIQRHTKEDGKVGLRSDFPGFDFLIAIAIMKNINKLKKVIE